LFEPNQREGWRTVAKKHMPGINAHVARLLAAAFATIVLLGGATAFSIGFSGALEQGMTNPAERLERLSQALIWSQAAGIGSLSLLSFVLLALAWYVRERVIAPLEKLKRSLTIPATGLDAGPIWGLDRRDEIGAVARAAENLRVSVTTPSRVGFGTPGETAERLTRSAERLEQHAADLPEVAIRMRERVEESSLRAAKASHMAAEAAGLARDAANRLGNASEIDSRRAADALIAAEQRLAETIARFETRLNAADQRSSNEVLASSAFTLFGDNDLASEEVFPNLPGARDFGEPSRVSVIRAIAATGHGNSTADSALVLEDLVGNLDALERYANERKTIAEDEAVAFMAALIEAIDRLNSVADRVCATADESGMRAAE
jgi:hypothetical protein